MSLTCSFVDSWSFPLSTTIALKLALSSNGDATGAVLVVKLNITQPQSADITAQVAQMDTLTTQAITKQAEAWGTLLKRLETVVKLGDQLAEVGPRYLDIHFSKLKDYLLAQSNS